MIESAVTDPVDANNTHLDPTPKHGRKKAAKAKRAAPEKTLDVDQIPFNDVSVPKPARKAPATRKTIEPVITPYRAPASEGIAVEIARVLKSMPTAIQEGDNERAGKLAFIAFASIMDLAGRAIMPADIAPLKEAIAAAVSRSKPVHPDHPTGQ